MMSPATPFHLGGAVQMIEDMILEIESQQNNGKENINI